MNQLKQKYEQYIDALGSDVPKISEWLGMTPFSIYAKLRNDVKIQKKDVYSLSGLLREKNGMFPPVNSFGVEMYIELVKHRLEGNHIAIGGKLGVSPQTISNKVRERVKVKKYDIYALLGLLHEQQQKTEK